jgi:Ser/Thr protein kinase RdoA (MazF antagonist)
MDPALAEALDGLAEDGGPSLHATGRLTGGEVGATAVVDSGGGRYVAKLLPGDRADGAALADRLALLEGLRSGGYPVPRYLAAGWYGGHVLAVQEWAGGSQRHDLDRAMVEELVGLALRHDEAAGEDAGAFGAWLVGSLRSGCDGYCLHAPLERYDARTRRLLARVREIGAHLDPGDVPAGGIVHRDFHHRNALWEAGRVSAIVDWEGCGTGDPAFDLVTLAFGLNAARTTADARDLPWPAAAGSPPEALHAYAAHMALRQVDWSIRHRGRADVDRWLAFSERTLDALDD